MENSEQVTADPRVEAASAGLIYVTDAAPGISRERVDQGFRYRDTSGRRIHIRDRRVAKIVKACQDLPGQHLFQYLGEDGARHEVTSGDINGYLKDLSGRSITAKDFRTWNGTVLAALALTEFERFDSQAAAKRNLRAAIETVAARLGNTPAICRKCYIHPEIIECYLAESLVFPSGSKVAREFAALRPEEGLVLAFLRERLAA